MSPEERKAELRQLWERFAVAGEPVMDTDQRVADAACCQPITIRIWRSCAVSAPSEHLLKVLRREVARMRNKKAR